MREFYQNDYLSEMFKKRKNLILFYAILTCVVVLLLASIIIFYAQLPYGTRLRLPLMIALIVIVVLFVFYSFMFFNITFGRLNKYCEFLAFACRGNIEISKVTVIDFYNQPIDYSGNDFFRVNVLIWSEIENNYVERLIYVDNEFTLEDVKVGDVLTAKLKSNYLLGYKKEIQ